MQNNSRSLINFVIAWESKVHKVKIFIKVYKTQCTQFGSEEFIGVELCTLKFVYSCILGYEHHLTTILQH